MYKRAYLNYIVIQTFWIGKTTVVNMVGGMVKLDRGYIASGDVISPGAIATKIGTDGINP